MAESVDRLSGGRLVLGLGGGASNREFAAFGLPARSAGEKISALEEGLRCIRACGRSRPHHPGRSLLGPGGDHRPQARPADPHLAGDVRAPRSGAGGPVRRRVDPFLPYAPPEQFRELRDVLRRKAEEAGRDPDELTCAYNMGIRVDDRAAKRDRVIVGGADEILETLVGFARMGVTLFNFWPAGEATEQREVLAKEIVPAPRDAVQVNSDARPAPPHLSRP